ncbi:MAG: tRNA (adenosine(37)-N6)-threonylcarbamoyltransferase complex transferase subunit TsaD [Rhodothermales bacterium]|nr:tRNA (adenosine(37)-N6)-threonylcarbamoyltransferase complex transferase subunit TsaD [Rhodothermales bacterium]
MTILGIESSCDDTAAALVTNGRLVSSIVSSQVLHEQFGGVVPELASRDHQRNIVSVVEQAIETADASIESIDAVAVTYGPGLAGSLLVGLSYGKALAAARGIPLVGVNHLDGHIYSVFIEEPVPEFPFLCLVASGGHTMLVHVDAEFRHELLGSTRDDAAGEAFDKVGKMLGLPFPGGPEVDRLASAGDPGFHRFPRAALDGFDFSFSGVKTSVLYFLKQPHGQDRHVFLEQHLEDVCASFQDAVVSMLMTQLAKAVDATGAARVAIVGGVSANTALREAAERYCEDRGLALFIPSPIYCMDNAAMIATAGYYKLIAGLSSPFTLTADANAAFS